MKTLQEFLTENVQIGLAKHAYRILSADAKYAIDRWETSGWVGGELEKHVKANDHVAQEIELAFAPIRAKLPTKIKLYRGIRHNPDANHYHGRLLESWTDDRKVAEHFAGMRNAYFKDNSYKVYSDAEIDRAVATYNKSGFVTFDGNRYARNKDAPQYYNIFDKNRQFVTDGDNLAKHLRDNNNSRKELNKDREAGGKVMERYIPRDKIVWITNNLDSKEYIVRV